MKNSKLVLGLTMCLGLLFSMNSIQENMSAKIGWAVASQFEADEVVGAAVGGAAGAWAGAEVGASIGSVGGPVGMAIGLGVGAL